METLKYVLCFSMLLWACITDVKHYKIRNKTVLCGIIGGLILNYNQILGSIVGMCIPLILIILFAMNIVGAGDIKLLCAVGAILGWMNSINIVLYSFVSAGIILCLKLLYKKELIAGMKYNLNYLRCIFWTKSLLPVKKEEQEKIPMALAITLAVGIVLLAQRYSIKGIYIYQ